MTILTTNSRETKLGNGVTTAFPFSVVFLVDTDLVVTKVSAAGVRTLWTLGLQYTLTGAGENTGGTLSTTPGNTLATGESVVIDRQVPSTQLVDFTPNSALPADTLERALDKLTMLAQELEYADERSLRLDPFDPATGLDPLPTKSTLPDRLLSFDVDGDPVASPFTASAVSSLVAGSAIAGSPLLEFNFVGDGTSTTYNLGSTIPSAHSLFVLVDGAFQPTSAYSVSTTNIVFSEAPPYGAVINVRTFFAPTGVFVPDSIATTAVTASVSVDTPLAKADRIVLDAGAGLTISGGVITVTGSRHAVDTEAVAASDNLDTINGGTDGAILVLKAANDARTVVVKDGTGNLQLAGDFSLTHSADRLTLMYDGTTWVELARSDNAA